MHRAEGAPRTAITAVDVVRVLGCPPTWSVAEFKAFFTLLSRAQVFHGGYTLARPQRKDGSSLEQVKLVCSLAQDVTRLVALGQTTVASSGRGTAIVKFQSVTTKFKWTTAEDSEWTTFAKGSVNLVSHGSQGTVDLPNHSAP